MLKIKIVPTGKKGARTFRIVAQPERASRDGSNVEILGSIDQHGTIFNLKKDRLDAWLKLGAQITPGASKYLKEK